MAFSDSVGLLFRISAKDEASDVIRKLRSNVESDVTAIGAKSKSEFDNLFGASSQLTSSFGNLVSIAAGVASGVAVVGTAAIGAGTALFSLARSASDFGSAIFDATEKTGLSAKTLSAYKFAADQSGASIEQITTSIAKFSRMVGESAQGSEEATAKLKRFGIEPKAAINDLDGALSKVFKTIAELPPGIAQATAAQQAFGKAGSELLPFIKSFDGDTEKLIARAKELGVVLTDEDARAADEFGDTLDTLSAQASGVARNFAMQFMPQITEAMDTISKYVSANQEVFRVWGREIGKYVNDTLTEIKATSGTWEEVGGILARRFVDAFSKILVSGVTGAVNAAALESRKYLASFVSDDTASMIKNLVGSQLAGAKILGGSKPSAPPQQFVQLEEGRQKGAMLGLSGAAGSAAKNLSFLSDETKKAANARKSAVKESLVNELLPAIGDGFKTYGRDAKTQFGKAETIDNLKLIAATFKDLTGKSISIGDLSKRGGGDTPRHKGHEQGTTADLRPVRKDGLNLPVNIHDSQYDQAATRALIELIKKVVPSALIRFNDPDFVKEGLTRRTPGHDNHLDVSGLGGKGNLVNLKKLEEDKVGEAEKAADKLAKIEDEAARRREQAQDKELQSKIKTLDEEVSLRESANKVVLSAQETLLKKGEINEQGLVRVRAALDDELLQKRKENKETELQLVLEYNAKELAAFDERAKIELERAKAEDKTALAAKLADERLALTAQNAEEEKAVKIELQKLDDDLAVQTQKNQQDISEGAKKSAEERKKNELELLEIRRDVNQAELDIANFRNEQNRKILANTIEFSVGKARVAALRELYNFETKIAAEKHKNDAGELERQRNAALERIKGAINEAEQKAAIDELYKNKAKFSEQEFQDELKRIRDGVGKEITDTEEGSGFFGAFTTGLSKLLEQQDGIRGFADTLTAFGGIAVGVFEGMAQAVGGAVQQWVLYGGSVGKALKQALAAELAHIASVATVKALYATALGFLNLAQGNFAAAGNAFISAGLWAALAAGTALAGRAVAGNSNQNSANSFNNQSKASSGNLDLRRNQNTGNRNSSSSPSSGTSGGAYSSESETRIREEERFRNRDSRTTAPVEHNTLTLQIPSNFIEREVISKLRGRGELHKVFVELIDA